MVSRQCTTGEAVQPQYGGTSALAAAAQAEDAAAVGVAYALSIIDQCPELGGAVAKQSIPKLANGMA